MTPVRPWTVIEDRAIDHSGLDRFDHASVARTMSEIIRNTTRPMAIGLLGGFGTGKSTVVNLLTEELKVNPDWAVLHVSAEYHSGAARVRGLLYALLEAAKHNRLITDQVFEHERARLQAGSQRQLPSSPGGTPVSGPARSLRWLHAGAVGLGRMGSMLGAAWLLGAALTAIAHLLGLARHIEAWTWFAGHSSLTAVLLSASVLATVLASAADGSIQTLKRYEITVKAPRPDSTDELEQVFSNLVTRIKKRLVIAIDDIDRLTAEEVLEALTVIRSLLLVGEHDKRHVVFVLSCDEDIVREAIVGVRPRLARRSKPTGPAAGAEPDAPRKKASEESAQEYLNKLFAVRVQLPAHHDADLRAFATARLMEPVPHPVVAAVGGPARLAQILDALIHFDVRDPRHALRLVNAFLTEYRVAQEREQPFRGLPPRIAAGAVTSYPLALARLIVLRHDYRDLYDRIQADHGLLDGLDDALLGAPRPDDDQIEQFFVEDTSRFDTVRHPGLIYLRATAARARPHRPAQLDTLLTLRSSPASRLVGSLAAQQIRSELVQRHTDAFAERLADEASCTNVLETAAEVLKDLRRGQDLDNAAAVIAQALARTPSLHERAAANSDGLGRALELLAGQWADARDDVDPDVPIPSPDLVAMLGFVGAGHAPELVRALKSIPVDDAEAILWAGAVLALTDAGFAAALRPAVVRYFTSLARDGDDGQLQSWLSIIAETPLPAAPPPEAYEALLGMAARAGEQETAQAALVLVAQRADEHGWPRPVLRGVRACLDCEDETAHGAVTLLMDVPVPDDGWGPATSKAAAFGATFATELAEAAVGYLDTSKDSTSAKDTADLLHRWLPQIGDQPCPSGPSVSALVAKAVGENAATCEELADGVDAVLADLSEQDASICVQAMAKDLPAHADPDEEVGRTMARTLTGYLHRIGPANTAPQAEAAKACLTVLTGPIAEDSAAGRFARGQLAAVTSSAAGARIAAQLADQLIAALPGPGQPHIGQLLDALHVLFDDKAVRAAKLRALLNHFIGWVNVNHTEIPVNEAALYAADPAVDTQWFMWISTHWNLVTGPRRANLVAAASRPELRQTPLPAHLGQHLLATDDAVAWSHAHELWPALAQDLQFRVLVAAAGRCGDLKQCAASAPRDVLAAALDSAGDELQSVLDLIVASPDASDAIATFVGKSLQAAQWSPNHVRTAVTMCPDTAAVWDVVLENAGNDLTSARRAAELVGALLETSPGTAPGDLVQRFELIVSEADTDTTTAIGAAMRSLPAAARRKLAAAIVGDPKRRTAFRKAAGL